MRQDRDHWSRHVAAWRRAGCRRRRTASSTGFEGELYTEVNVDEGPAGSIPSRRARKNAPLFGRMQTESDSLRDGART